MAKIISETSGKEVEVEDGSSMKIVEEEFNIPFGCEDGLCGSCIIEVGEGMENLTDKNDKERDMGIAENERLSCQCSIKQGVVKIKD
ncbi:ferredoxin [Candidatus Pacearchaeota archaeon]|nr:ferredoxin [Candidatus Pacearchaeota archaeon]